MEIVYYAPQKFFEKYNIFFVPYPKIPHIKNVGPLLSIFGFYPIQNRIFGDLCCYYTIYRQQRCYIFINFCCAQHAHQSIFTWHPGYRVKEFSI